jgi:predicted nucleic acid-binding protein
LTRFVLDASMTLAWLIDPTIPPYAAHVRQLLVSGGTALVPALWQWEVANGFVVRERRGLLTPSETAEILRNFERASRQIEISPAPVMVRRIVDLARESGLTPYDAAYLALAREQSLPLATLDRRLAEAAGKAGVRLLK